jgi:hypothetical protein
MAASVIDASWWVRWGIKSPQFVGEIVFSTMLVKPLHLLGVVVARGLDYAENATLRIAEKRIGVFDLIARFGQDMFTDPEPSESRMASPIMHEHRGEAQIVVAVFGLREAAGRAP